MPVNHYLGTRQGKAYLEREYAANGRSTYSIAEELGTYPNLVRRALLAFGIPLRSHSEAQKQALKSGRHRHPTRGRSRPQEVRDRISKSVRAIDDAK